VPVEHPDNHVHYAIDIRNDVHIRKSKDHKTLALEVALSARIALNLVISGMCCAVDFYNHSMGKTGKIHDELIDWDLPAELLSRDLQEPQPMPESAFGCGGIIAKLTGMRVSQSKPLNSARSPPHP
jgi:hypothetical protein